MIEIEKNTPLSKFTTFRIGGPAKYLVKPKNIGELRESIKWAKENHENYVVLGGGSNSLVSDNGYEGLVIIYKGGVFKFSGNSLVADGSAFTARLALEARKRGLGGLDFSLGIPGTIAGAVIGNAGAYGESMADVVVSIKTIEDGDLKEYDNSDLKFGYRSSTLKNLNSIIVTEVKIKLDYESKISDSEITKDREKRTADYGGANAGSYFTNIEVTKLSKSQKSLLSQFIIKDKVSVGKVIEALGLRGETCGGAMISENHGNVILNTGLARAENVLVLENQVIKRVKEKYNLILEPEIVKIGF